MKRTFLLSLAAVLLMSNFYVGSAEEPDPRILWVADSSIGIINGFAVHPNGNVFAYRYNSIFEIDGANGKILRSFVVPSEYDDISSIAISEDGKYLATSYDGVVITDLLTLNSTNVGKGNLVTFVTNSTEIAYRGTSGGTKGHDSSIVILDFVTGERRYIKTEEMITKIAYSPDGRFFATGGNGETFGKYYTSLKLWDANTLKLIKELERYEHDYQISEIKFSFDNSMVAFLGPQGLTIFNSEDYSLIKNVPQDFNDAMTSFTFLTNEELIVQTKRINLLNYITNEEKELMEFYIYGKISLTKLKNKLIVLTHYRKNNLGPITALSIDKLLSTDDGINDIKTDIEYQNGNLNIKNIPQDLNSIKIEIFDIQGHQLKHLDLQTNVSELKIPVKLPTGTYLIRITDAKKEYSSKFIVME